MQVNGPGPGRTEALTHGSLMARTSISQTGCGVYGGRDSLGARASNGFGWMDQLNAC